MREKGNMTAQSQRVDGCEVSPAPGTKSRNGLVVRAPIDRLRDRLKVNPETGCHEWQGWVDRRGYAKITISGHRGRPVHRVAYEAAKGPIPAGLHIDHLCRNPRCCNPDHLEAVTLAESVRRGVSGQREAAKTACPQGHPYSPENTAIDRQGGRYCLICKRERTRINMRRYRARLKAVQPDHVSDDTATSTVAPSAAKSDLDTILADLREAFRPVFDEQRATWEREGPAAMAAFNATGATLDQIGGNCPVQATGTVDGQRFYFRARGEDWQFHVAPTEDLIFDAPSFYIDREYGDWPDAGWMPNHEAIGFIVAAIAEYRALPTPPVDGEDGQV